MVIGILRTLPVNGTSATGPDLSLADDPTPILYSSAIVDFWRRGRGSKAAATHKPLIFTIGRLYGG